MSAGTRTSANSLLFTALAGFVPGDIFDINVESDGAWNPGLDA